MAWVEDGEDWSGRAAASRKKDEEPQVALIGVRCYNERSYAYQHFADFTDGSDQGSGGGGEEGEAE